jgi:hypothetical protein
MLIPMKAACHGGFLIHASERPVIASTFWHVGSNEASVIARPEDIREFMQFAHLSYVVGTIQVGCPKWDKECVVPCPISYFLGITAKQDQHFERGIRIASMDL